MLTGNTVLYSIENRETENTFTAIFDSITYIITVKWANFVEAFSSEALPIYKKLVNKMNRNTTLYDNSVACHSVLLD